MTYVYYSHSLNELFTLPIKPEKSAKVYSLFIESTELLTDVVYVGVL